jgi:hypothetical protein
MEWVIPVEAQFPPLPTEYHARKEPGGGEQLLLNDTGEVGPLLDAEGADVAH